MSSQHDAPIYQVPSTNWSISMARGSVLHNSVLSLLTPFLFRSNSSATEVSTSHFFPTECPASMMPPSIRFHQQIGPFPWQEVVSFTTLYYHYLHHSCSEVIHRQQKCQHLTSFPLNVQPAWCPHLSGSSNNWSISMARGSVLPGHQIRVRNWKLFFSFLNQNIQWDGSFEHLKHMYKLMDKKIIAILSRLFLLNWPYGPSQLCILIAYTILVQ